MVGQHPAYAQALGWIEGHGLSVARDGPDINDVVVVDVVENFKKKFRGALKTMLVSSASLATRPQRFVI